MVRGMHRIGFRDDLLGPTMSVEARSHAIDRSMHWNDARRTIRAMTALYGTLSGRDRGMESE